MKNITAAVFYAVLLLLAGACQGEAQAPSKPQAKPAAAATNAAPAIEIIQFHSEHRCKTCLQIEGLAKKTAAVYANMPFKLVNVDDKANEKQCQRFGAFGTALFLYNPQTGDKRELTDFAFMNAGNEEKFVQGLKQEILAFRQ